MRTYYFSIATSGTKYETYAKDLVASGKQHGIDIDVIVPDSNGELNAKKLKISGILNAPSWADRIVFLDADSFIIDPSGLNDYDGACFWPHWHQKYITHIAHDRKDQAINARRIKRLEERSAQEGIPLVKGTLFANTIWLSGTLTGHRDFMFDLANEWTKWLDIYLECSDGEFRQDQASFKFAYQAIHNNKYKYDDVPLIYNISIKKEGFPGDAKIIHYAGNPKPQIRLVWNEMMKQAFAGTYKGFDAEDTKRIINAG